MFCQREAIKAELGSLLMTGLFLMFLALEAYLRVFSVSSKLYSAGEIHAIIVVQEFPPRESCSILVSLESQYGTCWALFVSSVKAEITFPNDSKPLLILMPSFIVFPVAPVFLILSLPARSTKWNFATMNSSLWLTSSPPSVYTPYKSSMICCSIVIVKIAWDLELTLFINVLLVDL